MSHITIEECRTLLGPDAEGRSDEDIAHLRDSLEDAAVLMYDEVARQAKADPESVCWVAYAFDKPQAACPADRGEDDLSLDAPNLLEFPDETMAIITVKGERNGTVN
jgi:hypothetical protein